MSSPPFFVQKLQCINNMWSDITAYQHIHYVVAKFKLAFGNQVYNNFGVFSTSR